jgi:hypothetical protein
VLPGCSNGYDTDGAEESELGQVFNLYRGGPKGMRARPPSKMEELRSQRALYPRGYIAIEQKKIVVAWGTNLAKVENPETTVLAYERQAPNEGGSVLMADGTIKTMTPQEFQAAPKGKK